jgi:hypothetical protein
MGNRVLDVNGYGREGLEKIIEFALLQAGTGLDHKNKYKQKIYIGFKKGKCLAFMWSDSDVDKFDWVECLYSPHKVSTMVDYILDWISTNEAKDIELDGWHCNAKHDGSNTLGWQIYMGCQLATASLQLDQVTHGMGNNYVST